MERGAWLSPYGRKESDSTEATEHTAWVCDPSTKIPHTMQHGLNKKKKYLPFLTYSVCVYIHKSLD